MKDDFCDNDTELISAAKTARNMAYSPYSRFKVGAALRTKSGKIYRGCNIENASYGACNCAERTAIFKAVSEGDYDFESIAIVSSSEDYTYPCGICRQVMSEFFDKDCRIILDGSDGVKTFTVEEMLPHSFTLEH